MAPSAGSEREHAYNSHSTAATIAAFPQHKNNSVHVPVGPVLHPQYNCHYSAVHPSLQASQRPGEMMPARPPYMPPEAYAMAGPAGMVCVPGPDGTPSYAPAGMMGAAYHPMYLPPGAMPGMPGLTAYHGMPGMVPGMIASAPAYAQPRYSVPMVQPRPMMEAMQDSGYCSGYSPEELPEAALQSAVDSQILESSWDYMDTQGKIHKGFAGSKLVQWYDSGWFDNSTRVRSNNNYWTPLVYVIHLLRDYKPSKQQLSNSASANSTNTSLPSSPANSGSAAPVSPIQPGSHQTGSASQQPETPNAAQSTEDGLKALSRRLFYSKAGQSRHLLWWYIDSRGQQQGPHSSPKMFGWYCDGVFSQDSLVVGVHSKSDRVSAPARSAFRSLRQLLAMVEAGSTYVANGEPDHSHTPVKPEVPEAVESNQAPAEVAAEVVTSPAPTITIPSVSEPPSPGHSHSAASVQASLGQTQHSAEPEAAADNEASPESASPLPSIQGQVTAGRGHGQGQVMGSPRHPQHGSDRQQQRADAGKGGRDHGRGYRDRDMDRDRERDSIPDRRHMRSRGTNPGVLPSAFSPAGGPPVTYRRTQTGPGTIGSGGGGGERGGGERGGERADRGDRSGGGGGGASRMSRDRDDDAPVPAVVGHRSATSNGAEARSYHGNGRSSQGSDRGHNGGRRGNTGLPYRRCGTDDGILRGPGGPPRPDSATGGEEDRDRDARGGRRGTGFWTDCVINSGDGGLLTMMVRSSSEPRAKEGKLTGWGGQVLPASPMSYKSRRQGLWGVPEVHKSTQPPDSASFNVSAYASAAAVRALDTTFENPEAGQGEDGAGPGVDADGQPIPADDAGNDGGQPAVSSTAEEAVTTSSDA